MEEDKKYTFSLVHATFTEEPNESYKMIVDSGGLHIEALTNQKVDAKNLDGGHIRRLEIQKYSATSKHMRIFALYDNTNFCANAGQSQWVIEASDKEEFAYIYAVVCALLPLLPFTKKVTTQRPPAPEII